MPKLTHNDAPLNPLSRAVGPAAHRRHRQHHHHPRRRQPARPALAVLEGGDEPLTYIGWGKTTQLGYGLGLAMGAKLAKPDKLCINVWGDAAIGFTGMDFETAVRERIPILSILLNNFSMAIELKVMPVSTEKYRSTDISGDYAAMARALRRLWRARHQARRHHPGDQARHREDQGRRPGAAGVHHQQGLPRSARLAASNSTLMPAATTPRDTSTT
jgi:hypothetical protein